MSGFEWVAAALIVVLSSARITRLLTFDHFPPIEWVRNKYLDFTDERDSLRSWGLLAYCPYCMSFWVTLGVVLAGYFSDWHEAWWLVNAIFGASYLAAMVMVHDGDDSENDKSEDT